MNTHNFQPESPSHVSPSLSQYASAAGQSFGSDPKNSSTKRNSALFTFFKWFKVPSSSSRESINTVHSSSCSSSSSSSKTGSCESVNSIQSNATVASFSFVPPNVYKNTSTSKCIIPGPETDTYRARLKQRDKRRETDKNLTLRKKYNLFFNRNPIERVTDSPKLEENTKSLPSRTNMPKEDEEIQPIHRRTNSESSRGRKAGAYLHVKGKRRAPQPPGYKNKESTMTLRRKKRVAPTPPVNSERDNNKSNDVQVICNDSLKLDHGILRPVKEVSLVQVATKTQINSNHNDSNSTNSLSSARSSIVETPVSPRPWYKRNHIRENVNKHSDNLKNDSKYECIERLPEVQFKRKSTLDLTLENNFDMSDKNKSDEISKRKSGMSFLTNISELDREASEIIKKEHRHFEIKEEMPEFMRPKHIKDVDSLVSPKRRSARDLIAKFNAITNVTRATVFGVKDNNSKYFGKQRSLDESSSKRQEILLDSHKKYVDQIGAKKQLKIDDKMNALMKSESASAVKEKMDVETPKTERKNWTCPKCSIQNEYWRIICHVCSAIKPYFDDFSSNLDKDTINLATNDVSKGFNKDPQKIQFNNLERSKTQIGFSVLTSYNSAVTDTNEITDAKSELTKKEEKEKLKRMLIEMKNSLPKKKMNALRAKNCGSIISECSENIENEEMNSSNRKQSIKLLNESDKQIHEDNKPPEVLIGFSETIYENIKVKDNENSKPLKLSSGTQTSMVPKQILPSSSLSSIIKNQAKPNNNYELMRPKDFESIYADKNSAAQIYANLAQNDELSLFFNMPKSYSDISCNNKNTDTIEINRLLRRLETAIAKGELTEAAIFAKELAQLKVSCSVIRQKNEAENSTSDKKDKSGFQIEMFVEDKVSHRGPFPLQVTQNQTVAELKKQVEKEFEIPSKVQRWILGKELATNEKANLKDYQITEGCPVFLYLVLPDQTTSTSHSNVSNAEKHEIPLKDKQNERRTPKIVEVIPKTSDKSVKDISDKSEVFEQKNFKISITEKANNIGKTKNEQTNKEDKEFVKDNSSGNKKMLYELKTDMVKKTDYYFKENKKSSQNNDREMEITVKKEIKPNEKVLNTAVVTNSPVVLINPERRAVENISLLQNKLAENRNAYNAREKLENQMLEYRNHKTKEFIKHQAIPSTSRNKHEVSKTEHAVSNETLEPPRAKLEDLEEFDKTLKPQPTEWECHLCTLLNPVTSNVCSICATVRLNMPAKKSIKKRAPNVPDKVDLTYLQLVNLDNTDLVENTEPFECLICFMEVAPKKGVTLRECLHQFCKTCLAYTIQYSEEAEIKCPYRDNEYSCNIPLQDREIKSIVTPEVYDQYLAKSVAQAENKSNKSFHCKTPDCKGWCIFEDNVNEFRCPVCKKLNCLTCQAIHTGLNCKQYQQKMNEESNIDENAKRTKEMLEEMVNKGEALNCPTCNVILMKKWGCDWLRCSMCKTEICWVTRGPRWGPAGKGDTSGGCKCGVNNVKCHPQCNYCH